MSCFAGKEEIYEGKGKEFGGTSTETVVNEQGVEAFTQSEPK